MLDGGAAQEIERLRFYDTLRLRFGDQRYGDCIALVRERDAQNRLRRLQWPFDRKQARTSGHHSSADRVT
jgi:hypothetical protein